MSLFGVVDQGTSLPEGVNLKGKEGYKSREERRWGRRSSTPITRLIKDEPDDSWVKQWLAKKGK